KTILIYPSYKPYYYLFTSPSLTPIINNTLLLLLPLLYKPTKSLKPSFPYYISLLNR
ncbi:hypothetical protein FOC1_g10000158, partial [Fusarium oxysporum f. sp. cubense race 1]